MLDRYISLALLAAAGASLYDAVKLAGGAGGVRGALFPLVLTAVLALLSTVLLIGTFRPKRSAVTAAGATPVPGGVAPPGTASPVGNTISPERMRQSLVFLGFFILYVAAVKPLGFLVASTLMGTVVLRLSFRESWWQAFLI